MHESDRAELRRMVLRVLQRDFQALSAPHFELWAHQVIERLDKLDRDLAALAGRVMELETQLERLDGRRDDG